MSTRDLKCPNCGAIATFSSPGTLVVVCTHCAYASRRTDVALEEIGQVSMPVVLESSFQLGTRGRFEDEEFTVKGQLQLDHGAGPWNEWCALTEKGQWLWLAEAQGRVLALRQRSLSLERADLARLKVGGEVHLDDDESFIVSEVGEGTVLTARGELPLVLAPGQQTRYIDLSRADGFATLDLTRPEVELFLGRAVEVEELALDERTTPSKRPVRVAANRLACKNCGAAIQIFDPQHAETIGCLACNALLDARSEALLAKQHQDKLGKPLIQLGTQTRFRGHDVTVMAFLRRGVRAEGRLYPWSEYLLRDERREYSWLVENNGHWLHAVPLAPGAVRVKARLAAHQGVEHKHFDGGKAQVLGVLGELYWKVRVGDSTTVADYVAPGSMLSIEKDGKELAASNSTHVSPAEVASAFHCQPKQARGVGPLQPNPHAPAATWTVAGLAFALLILFHVVHRARCNRVNVFELHAQAPLTLDAEQVAFSEAFEVAEDGTNLHVRLASSELSNGWLGVQGALVSEVDGQVRTFPLEVERYSGVTDGESWSEGSRTDHAWLGPLPPGRYRLRTSASGFDHGLGADFDLCATRDEPRALYFWLAALLLLVPPLASSALALSFEKRRWDASAHPWGEE